MTYNSPETMYYQEAAKLLETGDAIISQYKKKISSERVYIYLLP
jgi:hypothetical protein